MGTYHVEIKRSALREIERLPNHVKARVVAHIEALGQNPRPPGCVKLSGQERYRVRVGDYRIVYEIHDAVLVVVVVRVGHRRDVYRD